MKVGDKIKVLEVTLDGTFEWDGEIIKMESGYVETKHCRNYVTHPQWREYNRAYEYTWIKHYYHPDGKLNKIKMVS